MAKPAKWPYTRLSAIPSVVQRVHQRPAPSRGLQQLHIRRRPVPYHATEDVRTCGDYPRQRTKRAGRVFQREPSTSKSRQDPANGIPSKEPPCRPQTECHLDHTNSPVYLGITLDRSRTYRNHCMKTRTKLSSRNNLLRKLHGTNWGACPHTMRTTAILRCLSVAEYCCPGWARSTHRKLVDTTLNETCRLITGCIRPTATPDLYVLSGIAPPEIRRSVHSQNERTKQLTDFLHVMLDEFVCKLYATRPAITSIDALWYNLFCARKGDAESHQLPPCQDCLKSIAYVPTIKLQCGEGA